MNIKDISKMIKTKLEGFEKKLELKEVGYVFQVGDGIATVYGLEKAMYGELVQFPHGVFGMILELEHESAGCILFGEYELVKEGDEVRRTESLMQAPVGDELLGRIINPIGEPLDGKGPINAKKTRPIETMAPGVIERQPVTEPLQTGIKAIDSMIPIGRGQRELIIGDRQLGKTAILLDTIINQKNMPKRPICIYVAIGQQQAMIAQVVDILKKHGALEYTIIVSASASDPAPLQYIAPYVGCTIGEEFMWQGKDVLCIYDDLTRHAQAYRQISLLLRMPPGREAYPGDIFYLHSRLLERACKLSEKNGGGSMTALPIIETQAGDITSYIPTNVISITDGQIYLENKLFYAGIRPAVNIGLSVSRVGGNAQTKAMRQVAGRLRLDMAQYNELQAFAQFSSELDKSSRMKLIRGEKMIGVLKQDQYKPLSTERQVMIIFAGVNGFLDSIRNEDIGKFESEFFSYIDEKYPEIPKEILIKGEIDENIQKKLEEAINKFKTRFI